MRSILCAVLVLLSLVSPRADEPDPLRVADLLFPESRGWPRFEELPAVPMGEIDAAGIGRLRRALRTEAGPDCPAFALDPARPLRRAAMRGEALIYSGPAHCREGAITIVWRPGNRPDAFTAEELPYRLLRLRAGAEPNFTSHEPGCCGDPLESYNLVGTRGLLSVRSTIMLQVPAGAVEARAERRFEGELVLRTAPEIADAYNPDLSELLDQAVFGNIARRYLAGTAGEQLLGLTDAAGRRWSLVRIAREHNVRAYHNPLPVHLGWIAE